jgi:hypothetical protein
MGSTFRNTMAPRSRTTVQLCAAADGDPLRHAAKLHLLQDLDAFRGVNLTQLGDDRDRVVSALEGADLP